MSTVTCGAPSRRDTHGSHDGAPQTGTERRRFRDRDHPAGPGALRLPFLEVLDRAEEVDEGSGVRAQRASQVPLHGPDDQSGRRVDDRAAVDLETDRPAAVMAV